MDGDHHIEQNIGSTSLLQMVEHAARLLPEQAPLHAFVHHNTLHPFEHLPFEEAVLEGWRQLGGQPYQREQAFAKHIQTRRILAEDLEAVVYLDQDIHSPIFIDGPRRDEFRLLRLKHLFEIPRGSALTWALHETKIKHEIHDIVDAHTRTHLLEVVQPKFPNLSPQEAIRIMLQKLWELLESVTPASSSRTFGSRRREQLLAVTGIDTDQWVHPLFIRVAAAFLDQGIAYWPMPGRKQGFLFAFRILYGLSLSPPDRWMRGLSKELQRQHREHWTAQQTIVWALHELAIVPANWPIYIEQTLLSLRGWAGMMHQFELHPERAPVQPLPAKLIDYLAVQLTLDVFASRYALRTTLGKTSTFADVEALIDEINHRQNKDLAQTYEAFVMAQVAGLDPWKFPNSEAARLWLQEISNFSLHERQRLLHLAYERRHRIQVLDGLAAHAQSDPPRLPKARFQAIFCIDDREESLRRYLEEISPEIETFGYAGFFAVTMAYQGLEDIHARSLCPVNVQATHYVREEALESDKQFVATRRALGHMNLHRHVGSKTLVRGGLLTVFVGLLTMIPMVARVIFPRATEWFLRFSTRRLARRPKTRLKIHRPSETPVAERSLPPGYTFEEMTTIVASVFTSIGLKDAFSSLIFIVGHGSTSVNNPHIAAYGCGATAGGCGGPNARALAMMANQQEIRKELHNRGVMLPATTWVVGGMHNTCDDSIEWYDTDLIPKDLQEEFAFAQTIFAQVCRLNAHERCRRFDFAPLTLNSQEAHAHVQRRAVDLSEPRPEYNHATNAVCIVGNRARTRGLFLDRRAFLVSYDASDDANGDRLLNLIKGAVPVGMGINLEYYFSYVDNLVYGSGSKLPHNIVGLFGVMDGHASDLRTGLYQQMVELHEPVRLLAIMEAEPAMIENLLARDADLARLARNQWFQLVAWNPKDWKLYIYENGTFALYQPYCLENPHAESSLHYYQGKRNHLIPAYIKSAFVKREAI